jgi:hypothetical protein
LKSGMAGSLAQATAKRCEGSTMAGHAACTAS